MSEQSFLHQYSEEKYKNELAALAKADKSPKPENWKLSPKAVVHFLMGGPLGSKVKISPKYFGDRRLIEVAVASLATDRALLLVGVPGTAKTWVSEHIAAAICGDSKILVQGTAGIMEDALRYGWNYATLLKDGPSMDAIVPSPVMYAMQSGKIARIEELTRIPSDVQDSLLTVLSEKSLPVPELNQEIRAVSGFNIIATSNTRDKGVNELSAALQRRFNVVELPLPKYLKDEVKIVQNRLDAIEHTVELEKNAIPEAAVLKLVQVFRELRNGIVEEGSIKLKSPSAGLSTAEAISVLNNAQVLATHFGDGVVSDKDLAVGLTNAVLKDPQNDRAIFNEYLEVVMKNREEMKPLYDACKALIF